MAKERDTPTPEAETHDQYAGLMLRIRPDLSEKDWRVIERYGAQLRTRLAAAEKEVDRLRAQRDFFRGALGEIVVTMQAVFDVANDSSHPDGGQG